MDGIAVLKECRAGSFPADTQTRALVDHDVYKSKQCFQPFVSIERSTHLAEPRPSLELRALQANLDEPTASAPECAANSPSHPPHLTKRLAVWFGQNNLQDMEDICHPAYYCGLRVRSELLPGTFQGPDSAWDVAHDNTLQTRLASRDNRRETSVITRRCDCARNPFMCPHTQGEQHLVKPDEKHPF